MAAISAVAITAGAIQVTYGLQANSNVLAKSLYLTPYTDANNDVIWVCGAHTVPTGASLPTGVTSGAGGTTVLDKYLPQTCRTGS